jgi:hypothetical protein
MHRAANFAILGLPSSLVSAMICFSSAGRARRSSVCYILFSSAMTSCSDMKIWGASSPSVYEREKVKGAL